jgi:hypothetical protein
MSSGVSNMRGQGFQVRAVGTQMWDVAADNVDVEIVLDDGRRFVATFFTLVNVQNLFDKNKRTGECAAGLYLWAADMILVERLTRDVIVRTVADLLQEGELEAACSEVSRQRPGSG